MSRVSRVFGTVLLGVTLGAVALTVISSSTLHRAAPIDGGPSRAVAQSVVTASVTETELAYFVIGFPPTTDTFTIMLTDTVRTQEARDILSGVETDTVSVMGTIVKAPARYNRPWSYHLDPASIIFFDIAVEICDAAPQYVEEHLSEVGGTFLPGSVWCPASSRVIEEMEVHTAFLPVIFKGGWQGTHPRES
jgi:hypothetical protein